MTERTQDQVQGAVELDQEELDTAGGMLPRRQVRARADKVFSDMDWNDAIFSFTFTP